MSAPVMRDLTGQVMGRLTVIGFHGSSRDGAKWDCRCECGRTVVRYGTQLRRAIKRGHSPQCGEHHPRYSHGMTRTRLYRAWRNMLNRCYYKNTDSYPRYGGRGITVCEEWRASFDPFRDWALSSGYADSLQIDRIDTNGGYGPENCRWVTLLENHNNRRVTRLLTWDGRTQTVREWADELGYKYDAIQLRITRGWSTERIFTQPFRAPR